jgi:hypothetical protein
MLMRMFVANGVAQLGGWLDWVAKMLPTLGSHTCSVHVIISLRKGADMADKLGMCVVLTFPVSSSMKRLMSVTS